jgi:predicted ATP-binding protein involved in virulence
MLSIQGNKMRIEKVHLVGVGVFRDTTIEFSKEHNIHIFTGENGTGKTTLLHALAGGFKSFILKEEKLAKSWHSLENSFVEISFDNSEELIIGNSKNKIYSHYIQEPTDHVGPFRMATEESRRIERQSLLYRKLKFQLREISKYRETNNEFDFIVLSYSGSRSFKSADLNSGIKDVLNSPFENILDFEKSIDSNLIVQWIANNLSKYSLALVDGEKEEAQSYKKAISKIEETIYEITNLKIEFKLERKPLNLILSINNKKYEFDILPDGLKSIISWIADLLMRMDRIPWIDNRDIFDREFILFLDEIDIHLHPSWQRKILIVVQKLFKNAQIFISTHSPFVVGSIEGAKVYILDKNGNVKVEDSKAGYRYSYVAGEIFGIDDEFDIETEKDLDQFAELRDIIYKLDNFENFRNKHIFLDLVEKLSSKSVSLQNLIGREIRQLEKVTGFQIA